MTPTPANSSNHGTASIDRSKGSRHPGRSHRANSSDPNYLSPEDAFHYSPPPRAPPAPPPHGLGREMAGALIYDPSGPLQARLAREASTGRRRRERTRKRKSVWKKLLWVKQSCSWPSFSTSYLPWRLTQRCIDQTRIIIPMKRPSWIIFSETHVFGHTSSGH